MRSSPCLKWPKRGFWSDGAIQEAELVNLEVELNDDDNING